MSQWGQSQPQYPIQTGYNPQFPQNFGGGLVPQQTGFPGQRPHGFTQSQPTGYLGAPGLQQQQPGFQQQPTQQGVFQQQQPQFQQPQQTGFPGNFVQQQRPPPPPVPPLPNQFQQQNVGQGNGLLGQSQQQQPNRFLNSSSAMAGSGVAPQATGFPGAAGFSSGYGGGQSRPLVPQATGYIDPRLTMMSNLFMPANPSLPYAGGAPQLQPQTGLSLQQNFQQHNQAQRGTATPKVPWTLTKAEKKNYDQIFRSWDTTSSGFISGQTALEVFGQSGLDKNELAQIWALADADNRGKLNLAEFHVAMGLIFRRLNGNELPDELPQEMVPPSARDLNSSVDIVKEILKNDTRSASYNAPLSKMRERSFNSPGASGAGGRQDATVYKHDETTPPPGGVYQPRSRHVDRSTVRVNSDDPVEDLSVMRRQLENTARMLDRATEESASRTREDEELEREMGDLRYRIKHLQDDLDYVSRGPRSVSKDEERRKLERELLHLMHEKLPSLEKKIEENQIRKDREKRDQLRERDRRNEHFGKFSDGNDARDPYRYKDEDGRYSRGSYSRDDSRDRSRDGRDRDYSRRDYDKYDNRGERGRDYDYGKSRTPPRERSPPPPPPPAVTSGTTNIPPPAPAASPATGQSKMSREEYKAFIKAEAQRKVQERLRAYGVHTVSMPSSEFSDVEERLAQEKKEAEEKAQAAEKAAEERIRLREERLANEKALKEGVTLSPPAPAKPPHATTPTPPPPKSAPPPPKSAPPPPKPRSRPPPRKVQPSVIPRSPPKPPVFVAPMPTQTLASPPEPEVDPEEEIIRKREAELQKKREAREAREARIRELERQEEEEARLVEAEIEKRKQALEKKSSTVQPPAPPSVMVSPPPPPSVMVSPPPPAPPQPERRVVAPPPSPLVPSIPTTPGDKSSTNPFNRFLGDVSVTTQLPAAPSAPTVNGRTNPFFRSQTAPPPAANVVPSPPKSSTPVPIKTIYHTAPTASDDDWDEIVEKEEGDSSGDEFTGSRDKRKNLAEKFFGNILPPARPQSAGPAVGASRSQTSNSIQTSTASSPSTPQPPDDFGVPNAPPPPPGPPPPPASVPVSNPPENLNALLGAIQGGARLKKAVTNDRSGSALSGKVLGNATPPPHITSTPPTYEPDTSFLPRTSEDNSNPHLSHRQSIDWYAGLAADHGAPRDKELSLPVTVEEDELEPMPVSVPNIHIETIVDNNDPLEDVDRSVEYRVRTLYPYEGQRSEDLSFSENLILTAHPSKSGGEWWYGTVVRDNKSGFFPQTYVDRIQSIKAKAMYSYTGNGPDELPFVEGDHFTVVDRSEGDWWKAEQGGLVYIVPAAYLEVVEDAQPHTRNPQTIHSLMTSGNREETTSYEDSTYPMEPPYKHPLESESEDDSDSEYLSFTESEDYVDDAEEQHKREREAREVERKRVLEAAGLIVKKDERRPPPRVPHRSNGRRPPPAVPDRTSMVMDSFDKDLPVVPTEMDADENDHAIRLDDAYERYEAFKLTQSTSASRLSVASFDTTASQSTTPSIPPPSPPFTKVSSEIPDNRSSYSTFLSFLGRSRTPANDSDKRSNYTISAPILGPIVTREPSPADPENTPGFGKSWTSLVDKSALEGIPPSERRRQEAIFELINTENTYVRDLQLIVEVFYSSMIPLLDQKAITVIFANIEDILLTNTTFLSSLEERQKDCRLYIDTIGDILRSHIPNMKVYMEYCVNEGIAIKVLQSLRNSKPELGAHLQRLRDDPSVRNLDLSSYLLAPMQRITRYPLLIRQILQYTEVLQDRDNIEQSLNIAESILGHINESIRDQEGQERLRSISQDLWVGQGRLDLTAPTRNMGPRRLIKEGVVTKSKSGRKLRAFLCSDILVLTDENAKALYRMPIPLSEVTVGESSRARDDVFHIIVAYPRGGGTISLRATSVRECQLWVQIIASAHRDCRKADERAIKHKTSRR